MEALGFSDQVGEEHLALSSIYDASVLSSSVEGDHLTYSVRFEVDCGNNANTRVIAQFKLTSAYPAEAPIVEIREAFGQVKWLDAERLEIIYREIDSLHKAAMGQVVVFEIIEWLREFLDTQWRLHVDRHPEIQLRSTTGTEESMPKIEIEIPINDISEKDCEIILAKIPQILSSPEPLVDRKSVFIAHIAAVSDVETVLAVMKHLLTYPKIRRATHNILAYRIVKPSAMHQIVVQDYDDDGESAAGSRLLKLLEMCKCENVMVVVSRWYGGVQLGPDRFKHINNCARSLLASHGFITSNH